MKKEKWKRVQGHSLYLISSWGRVFSLKREKILRPYLHKSRDSRYLRVEIDGQKYMLHVIVATHFHSKEMQSLKIAHPDKQLDVDHKDRNTLNCNENNLRWLIHSDNLKHWHETSNITFNGKAYRLTKDLRDF